MSNDNVIKIPSIYVLHECGRSDTVANLRADLQQPIWKFGRVDHSPSNVTGFGVEDDATYWWADMSANRWSDVLLQDILDKLEEAEPEARNYNFKSMLSYAGAKNVGMDGYVHVDREFEWNEHGDGYKTFLFFPDDIEWEPEMGGELQFFDRETGAIIATVYPHPRMCIIFDSNIPHRGLAPRGDRNLVRRYISIKTFVNKIEIQ